MSECEVKECCGNGACEVCPCCDRGFCLYETDFDWAKPIKTNGTHEATFIMDEVNWDTLFDILGKPPEPSTHAVLIEQKVQQPAPLKPIKGVYPWGVGKKYRACRRRYAQAMRKHKKTAGWHTEKTYYPNVVIGFDGSKDGAFTLTPVPRFNLD